MAEDADEVADVAEVEVAEEEDEGVGKFDDVLDSWDTSSLDWPFWGAEVIVVIFIGGGWAPDVATHTKYFNYSKIQSNTCIPMLLVSETELTCKVVLAVAVVGIMFVFVFANGGSIGPVLISLRRKESFTDIRERISIKKSDS